MKNSTNFSKGFSKRAKNFSLILKAKNTIPEVGMGATRGSGSDCYPYTVQEVADDFSYILVTADNHTPAEGFEYYGNQIYNYETVDTNPLVKYTLRKNGHYVMDGASLNTNRIWVGHRKYYQDPSF